MKKRTTGLGIAVLFLAGLLAGCGNTGGGAAADPAATQEAGTESTQEAGAGENTAGDSQKEEAKGSDKAQDMVGEWTFMCSLNHSEDSEGSSSDYVTMYTDEMAPVAEIVIRKDGEKYLADYKYNEYEYYCAIFGAELEYEDKAADGTDGPSWQMKFNDPFAKPEDGNSERRISIEDDTLVVSSEYQSAPSDEYSYRSVTRELYLRKDSPRFDDPEALRYFDTVTVSDAVELLSSVQNNRKIILEAGTYDLSKVQQRKINNDNIGDHYGTYSIENISNLCIEAAEGAKVLICIDDPYAPVMSFIDDKNITLRGVTVGHNVEPGYCSGSVLDFQSTDSVDIDNCKLFGCGTYGIEAQYTYNMHVKDTDIYECTYGLVSLNSVSSIEFSNCTLRDSSDMSMIDVDQAYDVLFEDCTFSNNRANAYDTVYFVELGEYDRVTFRNCAFNNNEFNAFSNREVTLENCTATNNHAGFNDMINSSGEPEKPTKESVHKDYDDALKRQAEIDEKLKSDNLLDQLSLNQIAFEEYDMWDSLLNKIWTCIGEKLDEAKMEELRTEQQKWIREKEASMKEAGSDFQGGSMQPMIEYGSGATITQKRVEELLQLLDQL